MADQPKVHPDQDPEAPPMPPQKPTTPLVDRRLNQSENGDPERPYHPPQVCRSFPTAPPGARRRSCCCGCCKTFLCWILFLLVLIIVIPGIAAAVIYQIFQPKLLSYAVDSMRITQFNLTRDNFLSSAVNINITARNPNRGIGIYCESGSHMSFSYAGTRLCEGSFPVFYQGHRNTTLLSLKLAGETPQAAGLLRSLQAHELTGTIPLDLRGRVPIRVKLGHLRFMKWKSWVRCRLIVDSLANNSTPAIRESRCRFRLTIWFFSFLKLYLHPLRSYYITHK